MMSMLEWNKYSQLEKMNLSSVDKKLDGFPSLLEVNANKSREWSLFDIFTLQILLMLVELILRAIFVNSWCGIVDRRIMMPANGSLDSLIMDASLLYPTLKGSEWWRRDGLILQIMNFDQLVF